MFEFAQFPRAMQRNFWKELDSGFLVILLFTAIFCNAFIFYMKDQVYVPSLEDKQKFLEKLYRVRNEQVSDEILKRIVDQEELKKQEEERQKEEAKEQKVEEVLKERQLTQEQRRAIRDAQKQQREAQTAQVARKAATMFAAVGVKQGGQGVGKTGITATGGSGAQKFVGIVGGGKGIVSGSGQTLGGMSKIVSGGAVDVGSGDIEMREVEAGNLEAGDLAGGIEMEDIEEVRGAGAQNILRSTETLNSIIKSKAPSIQRCYEKYRRRDAGLNGRLTIRFVILSHGRVDRITIVSRWSDERVGAQVEECVRNRVTSWRFDPISEGEVTIEFPMSFY